MSGSSRRSRRKRSDSSGLSRNGRKSKSWPRAYHRSGRLRLWFPSRKAWSSVPSLRSESGPKPSVSSRSARRRGVEPVEAGPTIQGSRGVFDLLAAFLEERSIRWGELVGGLLIVGCSLALVISFWASIAERPWIKYGLLNGVTALLFVLASHADRRWRLPTTARGLGIIATLLTPLNFLAVASLASGAAPGSAWSRLGEAVAIAIFTPLVYRAGRTLVAGRPWTLLVGVVAPSAAMLLVGRSFGLGPGTDAALILGALPWLAVAVAVGGWLARFWRDGEMGEARALELLRLIGLATFAGSVALGLVIAHAGPIGQVAHSLAPLASLIGGAILAPGLLLWRRVQAAESGRLPDSGNGDRDGGNGNPPGGGGPGVARPSAGLARRRARLRRPHRHRDRLSRPRRPLAGWSLPDPGLSDWLGLGGGTARVDGSECGSGRGDLTFQRRRRGTDADRAGLGGRGGGGIAGPVVGLMRRLMRSSPGWRACSVSGW